MTKFNDLFAIDVNKKVEKKNGLSYLSWSYAWAEFMKFYPDAVYEVIKFDGKPYYSDDSGAMVYTKVTAGGITHEMWLPVMDSSNKAMKDKPYQYDTRNGKKTVEAFTMFDVNKTIMRCLVKNLAMFGLGLYIYAGEDIPETFESLTKINQDGVLEIESLINQTSTDKISFLGYFKVSKIDDLTIEDYKQAIKMLAKKIEKQVKEGAKNETV